MCNAASTSPTSYLSVRTVFYFNAGQGLRLLTVSLYLSAREQKPSLILLRCRYLINQYRGLGLSNFGRYSGASCGRNVSVPANYPAVRSAKYSITRAERSTSRRAAAIRFSLALQCNQHSPSSLPRRFLIIGLFDANATKGWGGEALRPRRARPTSISYSR